MSTIPYTVDMTSCSVCLHRNAAHHETEEPCKDGGHAPGRVPSVWMKVTY